MSDGRARSKELDRIMHEIIEEWYQRVKPHYITEDDVELVGLDAELKRFHEFGNHRIKFARKKELDVTYGLGVAERDGRLLIESSVNNKSEGFDFETFVEKLKAHYWRSRYEKPWTDPDFDHFTYGDLLEFEPRVGKSVSLDIRKEKADIIRLSFAINPAHLDLLMRRRDILKELIEGYCLAPLKRIYAESYREQP